MKIFAACFVAFAVAVILSLLAIAVGKDIGSPAFGVLLSAVLCGVWGCFWGPVIHEAIEQRKAGKDE